MIPILVGLRRSYRSYPRRSALEEHLLELRAWEDSAQGYGPANLLALLREFRGHLRGLDLSNLSIRGASLQGVGMQNVTLAEAILHPDSGSGSLLRNNSARFICQKSCFDQPRTVE